MSGSNSALIDSYHLLTYEELDSTNAEARRLAEAGGAHGAVIWSRRQTQGKGRAGRQWVSQDGNLFTSFLLQPDKKLDELPQLSFVAAVAAIDALHPLVLDASRLCCKWPNDVLLDGRKLGGILLESFESEKRRWVVVGVGLNVDSHPAADMAWPPTNLKAAGVEIISAKIVLSRLIHHFILWYDRWQEEGFEPVRERWNQQSYLMGQPVVAHLPNETVEGISRGIDERGQLQLGQGKGKPLRCIAAADMLRPADPAPE